MKKVLLVVIAVTFISMWAVSSNAQVPNVQIYFNEWWSETQGHCQGIGQPQTLYVVLQNFNCAINLAEFGIDWGVNGAALFYGGDVHVPFSIFLGQSWGPLPFPGDIDGVDIVYTSPLGGFVPVLAMKIMAFWNCDTCDPGGANFQKITVVPHQGTGELHVVKYITNEKIPGIGMNAHACPGDIATDEATWGKIKALYHN
jgi:hypothetical protein